jgi:dihydroorotate dehydrogenase (NAD+) catalytic subunit
VLEQAPGVADDVRTVPRKDDRPQMPPDSLRTTLAGLQLASPLLLAAGTAGTLDEMADVTDLHEVGAVVTKSITALPREGNATWRILESRVGMLNAIGLANVGIEAFCTEYAPRAAAMPCIVIGSIAGYSVVDYETVARQLATFSKSIPALELNVSCPNVHGGTEFGADPGALREVVSAVRTATPDQKLFVKLSPITIGTPHSIVSLARAAIETGASGLTIANTIPAMEIDVRTRLPRLANTTGGLSGPAVHAVAVKLVHDVYRGVARDAAVPILGVGGVLNWRDAAEFVLAGATAVQVGTAMFADTQSVKKINRGLAKWAQQQGVSNLSELIGGVKLP